MGVLNILKTNYINTKLRTKYKHTRTKYSLNSDKM